MLPNPNQPYRPYRDLSDAELAAKRKYFEDWGATHSNHGSAYVAWRLKEVAAEENFRKAEQSA